MNLVLVVVVKNIKSVVEKIARRDKFMNKLEVDKAIKNFFDSIKKLKELGIIRSDTILGDIGEYLCQTVFPNLKLVDEKTKQGHDALENGKKVQIKYSGSIDTKNIDLGNPSKYDELIVVLKRDSIHIYKEDRKRDKDFYFYRFSSQEVKEKFKIKNDKYTLSKNKHFKKAVEVYAVSLS